MSQPSGNSPLEIKKIEFKEAPYLPKPPFTELFVTIGEKTYKLTYGKGPLQITPPCMIPIESGYVTIKFQYEKNLRENSLRISIRQEQNRGYRLYQNGNELPSHSLFKLGTQLTLNFAYSPELGIVIIGTADTIIEH